MIPRGVTNGNPGNIRKSSIEWNGQDDKGVDPAFVTFRAPVFGIRALAKILLNYQAKYNLNTVREIILRWAPPNENNTDAYVKAVCDGCNVGPDDPIDLKDSPALLLLMIEAIIEHENGEQPYSVQLINQAINLALDA